VLRDRAAKRLARLRAGARPRDLLGRVQLLLLALAILDLAGAFLMVLVSRSEPPILWVAGLAVPALLAATWVDTYRKRSMGTLADVITVAGLCLITMAVDDRWAGYLYVLFATAVFFTASYGSLPHVLVRTAGIAAIELGDALVDPAALTLALVFVVGLAIVAVLMNGLASSMGRYEATARRQQILAATGLDLVAASDLPAIAAAAVESAMALCPTGTGVRVAMAMLEDKDQRPAGLRVIEARGEEAGGLKGSWLEISAVAPEGQKIADQRLIEIGPEGSQTDVAAAPEPAHPFRPGEVLLTRVGARGSPSGVLIVESATPIPAELPEAVRALASQVSLAMSRASLQDFAIELQTLERFEALIQASADVISITGIDAHVRFQSPSVRQVFGYEPTEIVGRYLGDLVHPDDLERMRQSFNRVVADPCAPAICECRIQHADGSWRETETRISNYLHVSAIGGIVLNTRDVTERHRLEAELRHQAFHDSLTGLANRALFLDRVGHAIVQSRRHDSTVAVLYFDVDGLNLVNESFGYTAGDTALTTIAERLRANVRGEDTVARLAGDEFGILLDRLGSAADAMLAMERVMSALRQSIQLQGAQVELRPHIGIVVAMDGDETAEDMLRDGAVAMHRARISESGYAVFDPAMHADAIRRIEVEQELRTAIEEGQFILHYQPTIDLRTGRLTGVEALVRWQHPRRGLVPPMEFIPLAEESGLIVPLGQWTIKEACKQVRIWQQEIPADEPIVLNVNLSARQLRHPNIVRDIADALDDTGLLPSRLVLEITESVLMIDTSATLTRLYQLKSLGVRLAVDDFGTGYSSFAYLRRFPVDILKIDKSFVDGVATEPTSSALVDAMIRIGKTLRLETVAEGVERADQADRLRALQCDIGQGFLFSRPLPSEAITGLLRDRASKTAAQPNAA
jgi:diguanylate cyclase (GGDEF)-like protein/PAS domain S-box-containing protein